MRFDHDEIKGAREQSMTAAKASRTSTGHHYRRAIVLEVFVIEVVNAG